MGTLWRHSLLVRVHRPDSPVEGRVQPFRLRIWVWCQPTSWEGLMIRFVWRCSGSPLDVVQSWVMGLTCPATRLGQTAWMHETWWTHGGQMLWLQAPWGCSNHVETMTSGQKQSRQESNSDTWMMQSMMTALVTFYVRLRQQMTATVGDVINVVNDGRCPWPA